MTRTATLSTPQGEVSAIISEPPGKANGTRIALTHGAGGNMHASTLALLTDALAELGYEAVRFNLPYAEAKRRFPDRAPVVEAAWAQIAQQFREACDRLIIGGFSYGGRMASHVAAAEPKACDGLLLLSYPLHPPGKTDKLRTEHLSSIQVPILVVQGDRDPFASGTLLEEAFDPIPSATIERLFGGDHSHKVKGIKPLDVARDVAKRVQTWLGSTAS